MNIFDLKYASTAPVHTRNILKWETHALYIKNTHEETTKDVKVQLVTYSSLIFCHCD